VFTSHTVSVLVLHGVAVKVLSLQIRQISQADAPTLLENLPASHDLQAEAAEKLEYRPTWQAAQTVSALVLHGTAVKVLSLQTPQSLQAGAPTLLENFPASHNLQTGAAEELE
jgi:hypothetical protein